MKLPTTPETWIQYFARNNAKLVRRIDPVTGEESAIIRRKEKGSDRHLLGAKTRDSVVKLLLERYGIS